jgi:hypothetical protein
MTGFLFGLYLVRKLPLVTGRNGSTPGIAQASGDCQKSPFDTEMSRPTLPKDL